MTTEACDHRRPDDATLRTALTLARATLAGDPARAVATVVSAPCGPCLTVATMQLGYALCGALTGETGPVASDSLRYRLAAALEAAQLELDVSGN